MIDLCEDDVYLSIISPDKKCKAVIFERNCGATTGFSTQISIIDADQELKNSSGNVFIIDGEPIFVAPKIYWKSDNELIVNRPVNGTEYKAETEIFLSNKIHIIYMASDQLTNKRSSLDRTTVLRPL